MGTQQLHNLRTEHPGDLPEPTEGAALNLAVIIGELASDPEHRILPSGSVVMSFSLRVRNPGAKTTSVPISWYDPPKRTAAWKPGDEALITGEVVRRFYRGGTGLGSSTEVVVAHGELLRHRVKAGRVVARVQRTVAQLGDRPAC